MARRTPSRGIPGRAKTEQTAPGQGYPGLFELANDAVLIYDPESRVILDANGHACELYGFPKEELVGMSMRDLSLDVLRGRRYLRELLARGSYGGFETLHRHADGGPINVLVNASVVEIGGRRAVLSVNRDIRARKRVEEQLRLRDRAIVAARNGILITDPNLPDDPIVYANPAFERMTGYALDEVLGRNCRFLQKGDRDQPALDELREALGEGREFIGVLRNYRKDGTLFWNELSVSPVRDEGGRIVNFVGVQDDVTGRVRGEEMLKEDEERYRTLVEQIPAVVYAEALDEGETERKTLYVSPQIEDMLGYSRREWTEDPKLWERLLHPEDRERALAD